MVGGGRWLWRVNSDQVSLSEISDTGGDQVPLSVQEEGWDVGPDYEVSGPTLEVPWNLTGSQELGLTSHPHDCPRPEPPSPS